MQFMKFSKEPNIPETIDIIESTPLPSVKVLPEWFKKTERYHGNNGKLDLTKDGVKNVTVKGCVPFLDVLMTGYIIKTAHDILVRDHGEEEPVEITWMQGGEEYVAQHYDWQLPVDKLDPLGTYHSAIFKFRNEWITETPKGYSLLFTHPINRLDLPFYTFGGLVDTDSYYNSVQLPFMLKKGFSGVIPAGTPIVQIVPIKRESWRHKFTQLNRKRYNKIMHYLFSFIENNYRHHNWFKKDYR